MKIPLPQGAPRAPRPEFLPGLALLLIAGGLCALVRYRAGLPPWLAKLCLEAAAPLVLAAGGFLAAWFTARARERGPSPRLTFTRRGAGRLPPALEWLRNRLDRAREAIANIDWRGDWLPLGLMLAAAAAALFLDYKVWKLTPPDPSVRWDQWVFGSLIGLCFPLLVLERQFSAMPERRAVESGPLALLLRLILANLLLLALAFLCRWLQLAWWTPLEHAAALLTALIAGEILLRNAGYFFMPLPPLETRRGRAESLAAGLLRLQKPSLSAMSASVSGQFGIDLGRSWALGFIRRAAGPALLGLAIAGWLMTGLTALDISQRAVYEAFGRPQAVFHSGLHIHLPWPLGILKPVEYGVVREIPIVFPAEGGGVAETSGPATPSGDIEGPPPESAERLWDASHPSEASYLVASNRNGQETFEIVNIDLQILYRVGLSDRAAMDATYSIEAPDALIRAAAGRMLARYFARYTIPDILGQNREQFIRGFQRELQSRLNVLASGIDVLGVVVEAIHPPAEAATAYQDVQAATIRSVTEVATARGDAARAVLRSRSQATSMRDDAAAAAAETVNQAKVDTALFAGDVTAYHQDGAAFLFERRLSAINQAVHPSTALTVLDTRIPAGQMPTLDLRPPGSASTPPPTMNDDDN